MAKSGDFAGLTVSQMESTSTGVRLARAAVVAQRLPDMTATINAGKRIRIELDDSFTALPHVANKNNYSFLYYVYKITHKLSQ